MIVSPEVMKRVVEAAVQEALVVARKDLDDRQARRVAAAAARISDLNYPKAVDGVSFLIDIPPYCACTNGGRVVHYLAALLVEAGESVATTELCYFNPLIPIRRQAIDSDIVVLPDAQRVNNTGAQRVCRYMLCYAENFFKGRIAKNECAIVYQPEYLESTHKVCDHYISPKDVVYIPGIDPEWCFPGRKTIKNCLYGIEEVNKWDVSVNPAELAGVVTIPRVTDTFIDGEEHASQFSHQRTLAILRASKNFYTVDHNSAMSVEAALCGCRVRYLQPDGSSKTKWFQDPELQAQVMHPAKDVWRAAQFSKRVRQFFGA